MYIVNDSNLRTYTHEEFVVDPDYCPIQYTYVETPFDDADGNEATTISRIDKTYTFTWTKDLSPVGQTQTATVSAET